MNDTRLSFSIVHLPLQLPVQSVGFVQKQKSWSQSNQLFGTFLFFNQKLLNQGLYTSEVIKSHSIMLRNTRKLSTYPSILCGQCESGS